MKFLLTGLLFLAGIYSKGDQWVRKNNTIAAVKQEIITGADQTEKYVEYLKGKRVAVLANPTTIIGNRHLVDSLQKRGVNIVKVFGPEHGFRGNASNGATVGDEKDPATGIPIISLYGTKGNPAIKIFLMWT